MFLSIRVAKDLTDPFPLDLDEGILAVFASTDRRASDLQLKAVAVILVTSDFAATAFLVDLVLLIELNQLRLECGRVDQLHLIDHELPHDFVAGGVQAVQTPAAREAEVLGLEALAVQAHALRFFASAVLPLGRFFGGRWPPRPPIDYRVRKQSSRLSHAPWNRSRLGGFPYEFVRRRSQPAVDH